jgi:hypothetical protein
MSLTRAAALLIQLNIIGSGSELDTVMGVIRRNALELVQPANDGIEVTRRPELRTYDLHDRDADDLKPWD